MSTVSTRSLVLIGFLASISMADEATTDSVSINGALLTPQQRTALEAEFGEPLVPGNYVVDFESGCWANLSNQTGACDVGDPVSDIDVVSSAEAAKPHKTVIINGVELTDLQIVNLETYLGTDVVPGNYLVNPMNGCWLNTWTAESGCGVGGNPSGGEYATRGGSGEWNANGDWSHHSDVAGGSVGGSGDGCVYAFGWSNC